MTALVAPRIARRILSLSRGDSTSVRLARDYAVAYGADLDALRADAPRVEASPPPQTVGPVLSGAQTIRLAITLSPSRSPRARRAQILRRIARLAPGASVEASDDGLRVDLPAARAEALRERLGTNAEVAQLAVSDARVG